MKADRRVADFAFDFSAGNERGNRVYDDAVDGARANEHVADFKGLFAGIGLGDEHFVDIDAQARSINRVEGVFRIDERDDAAKRLRFGEDLQGEGRLAA